MKNRTVAFIQALILIWLFIKRSGLLAGSFALPPISVNSILNVYAPGIVGFSLLIEKIKLPGEQWLATILLGVIAFQVLVTEGRTDFTNMDNVQEGLLPAGGAFVGALKIFKAA